MNWKTIVKIRFLSFNLSNKSREDKLFKKFSIVAGVGLTTVSSIAGVAQVNALNDSGSPKIIKPVGVAGNWQLSQQDQFNGNTLDANNWIPSHDKSYSEALEGHNSQYSTRWNDAENNCYDTKQVSVYGGYLHLGLKRQDMVQVYPKIGNTTGPRGCMIDPHLPENDPYWQGAKVVKIPFNAGLVQSTPKFDHSEGVVEARVYLPYNPANPKDCANWGAIWGVSNDYKNDGGEIDYLECLAPGQGKPNVHEFIDKTHTKRSNSVISELPSHMGGWHTVSGKWQNGKVAFYYDGKLVQTLNYSGKASMNLILNNSVQQNSGTAVAPGDILVDYIREWKIS